MLLNIVNVNQIPPQIIDLIIAYNYVIFAYNFMQI